MVYSRAYRMVLDLLHSRRCRLSGKFDGNFSKSSSEVHILIRYALLCLRLIAITTPNNRLTFDTIKELASSRIECGAWGEQNKEFFLSSADEASQQIGQNLVPTDNAKQAVKYIEIMLKKKQK